MVLKNLSLVTCAIFLYYLHTTKGQNQIEDIKKIFSPCHKISPDFDLCMKRALNKLRTYFKLGIPELGVNPFDPHFAQEVLQERRVIGIGYTLKLKHVYERGWTQSSVTSIGQNGDAFGLNVLRSGHWNLTLRDYSQTTRIKRNGSLVDVRVEVDHIGDMDIHVGNLVRGMGILEVMLDRLINATWKPGFAVIRPLINDLVSTAFTEIFTKSFGNFPIQDFIKD